MWLTDTTDKYRMKKKQKTPSLGILLNIWKKKTNYFTFQIFLGVFSFLCLAITLKKLATSCISADKVSIAKLDVNRTPHSKLIVWKGNPGRVRGWNANTSSFASRSWILIGASVWDTEKWVNSWQWLAMKFKSGTWKGLIPWAPCFLLRSLSSKPLHQII